jgi:hypothetical protein
MTHVLLSFRDLVKHEMGNIATVYDEELSYETAIQQFWANNDYSGNTDSPIPIFVFKRSVIRPSDLAPARRGRNWNGCLYIKDEAEKITGSVQYGITHGEMDVEFIYITDNIEMQEKFEVVYDSDEGITGTKELEVDIPEVGVFKYYLDYQDLTEKSIEHQDNYFKGVVGSLKIRGFYFTFRGDGPIIQEINNKIISTNNIITKEISEVLVEDIIKVE